MLPIELMAALALGVLWVNALLIAAASLQQRARLGAVLGRLAASRRAGRFFEGEVEAGEGGGGEPSVLAERRTAQIGRAMTVPGPDRILFTDKRTEVSAPGARVRTRDGSLKVDAADGCEVWIGDEITAERPADARFEEAWKAASTSRGVELDVVRRAGPGVRVWIEGTRDENGVHASLVSTRDPFAELARGRRVLGAMALGAVLGAAVVTAIALVPPVFGTVSTIGGALGLAFFLLVQPAGVSARNLARAPDRQPVGGVWQRGA